MMKLQAASRLLATQQVQATNQEEAGKLLAALLPVFGKNYKKKQTKSTFKAWGWKDKLYEEVWWEADTFKAGILLTQKDALGFWLENEGDNIIDVIIDDLDDDTDAAATIIASIKQEAKHCLQIEDLAPETKVVLTKLLKIK